MKPSNEKVQQNLKIEYDEAAGVLVFVAPDMVGSYGVYVKRVISWKSLAGGDPTTLVPGRLATAVLGPDDVEVGKDQLTTINLLELTPTEEEAKAGGHVIVLEARNCRDYLEFDYIITFSVELADKINQKRKEVSTSNSTKETQVPSNPANPPASETAHTPSSNAPATPPSNAHETAFGVSVADALAAAQGNSEDEKKKAADDKNAASTTPPTPSSGGPAPTDKPTPAPEPKSVPAADPVVDPKEKPAISEVSPETVIVPPIPQVEIAGVGIAVLRSTEDIVKTGVIGFLGGDPARKDEIVFPYSEHEFDLKRRKDVVRIHMRDLPRNETLLIPGVKVAFRVNLIDKDGHIGEGNQLYSEYLLTAGMVTEIKTPLPPKQERQPKPSPAPADTSKKAALPEPLLKKNEAEEARLLELEKQISSVRENGASLEHIRAIERGVTEFKSKFSQQISNEMQTGFDQMGQTFLAGIKELGFGAFKKKTEADITALGEGRQDHETRLQKIEAELAKAKTDAANAALAKLRAEQAETAAAADAAAKAAANVPKTDPATTPAKVDPKEEVKPSKDENKPEGGKKKSKVVNEDETDDSSEAKASRRRKGLKTMRVVYRVLLILLVVVAIIAAICATVGPGFAFLAHTVDSMKSSSASIGSGSGSENSVYIDTHVSQPVIPRLAWSSEPVPVTNGSGAGSEVPAGNPMPQGNEFGYQAPQGPSDTGNVNPVPVSSYSGQQGPSVIYAQSPAPTVYVPSQEVYYTRPVMVDVGVGFLFGGGRNHYDRPREIVREREVVHVVETPRPHYTGGPVLQPHHPQGREGFQQQPPPNMNGNQNHGGSNAGQLPPSRPGNGNAGPNQQPPPQGRR